MSEDSKRLILNIEADASSAAEGLKTLSTALSDFKGSSDATSPMRKIADAVRQIREAAGLIEADTGAKLTALGRGLSEVAKVGTISLKATTSDRIGNIALASRLLQVDSGTKLTGLAEGLKSLSNVTKLGITQTTGKQIGTAAEAAHRIPEDVVHKLSALAEGMNALSKVEKSSMGTTVSHLRRLPEILKNIEDVDISKLKPQIDALTEAMKPLAVEMDKIARGFSAMPKKLQSYITSMERAAKSTSKLTSSVGGGGKAGDNSIFRFFYGIRGQLITYTYLVRRVMSLLGGAVNEANKFIEDINLFTVAMGQYTREAMAYAEQVQEVMGIDMGEWMRNQGVFKTMAQGFGIAEDAAYKMSKGLTELAYDTASFYNISFESAMEKFRSGLAGQPRPLRELGFAIDDATLSQIALSQGITESTRSMNQADKAMLRYTAIMSQQKNIMGDLARTMHTPANAMRLLGARATTLARTFGSILIPILSAVIPYLQVFLELLIKAAQAMAALFGFELPTIDYSGIQAGVGYADELADGFDNVGDSAGNAGQAIKEFKNYLLGFDEMHIIPSTSTADSGGGGLGGIGGSGIGGLGPQFDWELPDHSGFMAAVSEEIELVREQINGWLEDVQYWIAPLLPLLEQVGIAFLFNLGAGLVSRLGKGIFHYSDETMGKVSGIVSAIGGVYASIKITREIARQFVDGELDELQTSLAIAGTGALTFLAMVPMMNAFDFTPTAKIVTLVATTLLTIIGYFIQLHDEMVRKRIEDRFGDIALSAEQAKEMARQLTETDFSRMIRHLKGSREELDRMYKSLDKISTDFMVTELKVQLGIPIDPESGLSELDTFAEETLSTLNEQLNYQISQGALFLEGDSLEEYVEALYENFSGPESQLQEIREEIAGALMGEGEVTPELAARMIEQYAPLIREIANANVREAARARMEAELRYDLQAPLGNLDYESVKEVLSNADKYVEGDYREATIQRDELIASIKIEFEDDEVAMNEKIAEVYASWQEEVTASRLGVIDIALGTITGVFELGELEPKVEGVYSLMDDMIENILTHTGQTFEEGGRAILELLQREVETGNEQFIKAMYPNITDEDREEISRIWSENKEVFLPTKDLLVEAIKSGAKIPENLAEGMMSVASLGALAGSADMMMYLLGTEYMQNEEYKNLLMNTQGLGEDVSEYMALGILSKLEIVRDSSGEIIKVLDSTTGAPLEITDTFVANIKALYERATGQLWTDQEVLEDGLYGGSGKGGGGRKITWLESWLESLGLGLGEGEVIAREGSQSVEGAVEENVSPEKWNLLGWLSGESLGSGSAAGILNKLFGLGDAAGEATDTLSGELGTWGAVGGEGGTAAIKEAAQKLKDDAGLLNSALSGSFRGLRDTINAQTAPLKTAMGNVTNGMMTPWNDWFKNVSDGVYKTMANVAKMVLSLTINKTATGGSYNLQYLQPTKYYAQAYAEGGFPSAGELFLMNEREPEFLTTVGGRTSVVNQDQMSRSLEAAIARGMAASGGGGQTGDLIIQIDGKEHNLGNIAELKRKNQRAGKAVIQVN